MTIVGIARIWVAIHFDIGSGPIDSLVHELFLLGGVERRGEVLDLVCAVGSGLVWSKGRTARHYVWFILIELSSLLHGIATISSFLLIYYFRLVKVRPPSDRINSRFPIWLLLCKEGKGLLDLSADHLVLDVIFGVLVVLV